MLKLWYEYWISLPRHWRKYESISVTIDSQEPRHFASKLTCEGRTEGRRGLKDLNPAKPSM